jgi:hypothetical protein
LPVGGRVLEHDVVVDVVRAVLQSREDALVGVRLRLVQ